MPLHAALSEVMLEPCSPDVPNEHQRSRALLVRERREQGFGGNAQHLRRKMGSLHNSESLHELNVCRCNWKNSLTNTARESERVSLRSPLRGS
jgi:hypothetical protein